MRTLLTAVVDGIQERYSDLRLKPRFVDIDSQWEENKELSQPYYFMKFGDSTTGFREWRTHRCTLAIHCSKGKIDKEILLDRVKNPQEMCNIAINYPTVV
jgi:hypothetical protein